MTATKAAKRSSEEKTRRQRDGVNVEVGYEFVIMGLADSFGLIRDRKLKLRFNPRRSAVSNLFPQVFMVLDAVPPKPKRVPLKGGMRYPLSFCRGSRPAFAAASAE
jgi:hypothetical protein